MCRFELELKFNDADDFVEILILKIISRTLYLPGCHKECVQLTSKKSSNKKLNTPNETS